MSIDFGNDIFDDSLVSTTFQPEDNGELSLRPHTLKEYIGQSKAKENLSIFIEAARRRTESVSYTHLVKFLAHFLQGTGAAVLNAEAELQHLLLSGSEGAEHIHHLLLQQGEACLLYTSRCV